MNASVEHKIKVASTHLILKQPFFATLFMQLERVHDESVGTMGTDGIKLFISESFVEALAINHLKFVVAHEVLHCALGHPWRRNGRNAKKWNRATDYVINLILVDEGFDMPTGEYEGLLDRKFEGMSADQIYNLLDDEPGDDQEGGDSGEGSGGGNLGKVLDPPPGQSKETLQAEWQAATIQAATAARARGVVPAFIKRLVEDIRKPKVDWRDVLRRWMQEFAKADYNWKMPNTRYLSLGLYLPSLKSEQMPPVIIYWDTSGSRDDAAARAECAGEAGSVIEEVQPEITYIIYGDTQVQRVDEFRPGEMITFNPKGGGGTDFACIFQWIEQQGIEPACFIGITDLEGSFPDRAPQFPVLWASTEDHIPPFGEVILISEGR